MHAHFLRNVAAAAVFSLLSSAAFATNSPPPSATSSASAGAGAEATANPTVIQGQSTHVYTASELNQMSAAGAFSGGSAGGDGSSNITFDGGDTTNKALGVSFNPPPFSPSSGPANSWGITETDAVGFPLIGGGYQDQDVVRSPEALAAMAGLLVTAWGDDATATATKAALCLLVPQFADASKLTRIDCTR